VGPQKYAKQPWNHSAGDRGGLLSSETGKGEVVALNERLGNDPGTRKKVKIRLQEVSLGYF